MNSIPNIAIIDYGAGNQLSVIRAFEYLGAKVSVLNNPNSMKDFSHVVLPGVGSFYRSVKLMKELNWDECLLDLVNSGKPLLGICLGMQLLFSKGTEDGDARGLNIIPGEVNHFLSKNNLINIQVPHVGFDTVNVMNDSLLFKDLSDKSDFYFTHSYIVSCPSEFVTGKTFHGKNFVSAVEQQNVVGTQFHPEKSQINGLNLLKNFINYF